MNSEAKSMSPASVNAAGHTPGPWHYAPILTASENDRGWLVAVPGTRVADVWPMCDEDGNASPEAEANARLVTAAPELLAELSHLVRLLEPLERDGTLNVPGLATLNGPRAAIAKATGAA